MFLTNSILSPLEALRSNLVRIFGVHREIRVIIFLNHVAYGDCSKSDLNMNVIIPRDGSYIFNSVKTHIEILFQKEKENLQ